MVIVCVHLDGICGMHRCYDNIGNACTPTLGASFAERAATTVHFIWPPYCQRHTDKFESRVR